MELLYPIQKYIVHGWHLNYCDDIRFCNIGQYVTAFYSIKNLTQTAHFLSIIDYLSFCF